MSKKKRTTYNLDEFVSYELVTNEKTGSFTITVEGPLRYMGLFANKIGNMEISDEDLEDWVE